jgi:hypothetical protein
MKKIKDLIFNTFLVFDRTKYDKKSYFLNAYNDRVIVKFNYNLKR